MYTDSQRRTHIYDLQRFLRRVQQAGGHPQPLIPDGIFGPETSAGLRAFQQQNRLPVTGTADLDTWTLLYDRYLALAAADLPPAAPAFFPTAPDATLRADSRGPAVFVLQLLLSSAVPHFTDTAPIPLTGVYDTDTARAVRQAQQAFLLPPTGETDRATWDALVHLHDSLFERPPLLWLLENR